MTGEAELLRRYTEEKSGKAFAEFVRRKDSLFGFRVGGCHSAIMTDPASHKASQGTVTNSMLDDSTLLRRYAEERAEDAFAELVRRHLDGVYSAALRRVGGDTHLAEDVAQQVFVALARKAAWLSRHPVLTGWLYLSRARFIRVRPWFNGLNPFQRHEKSLFGFLAGADYGLNPCFVPPWRDFAGRRRHMEENITDSELLRLYAEEKSEQAFAALVQRHLDLVYSAALRRLAGDAHAAADVAQQVFIAVARQSGSLARGVVLPGWLYATTRNVAVDFIRAEQRRRAREQAAHTMHEMISTPSSDPAWEQMRPMLDAAMDELATSDREAVLLRFFARRPFGQIATTLNLSEDAARMRVERALDKLRALLARRGVTSTAAAFMTALSAEAVTVAPAKLAATVTASAIATAAAGGSASLVSGAVAFMSTTKIAVGIAAVIAALAIGGAVHEMKIAERTAVELAALRQEHEAARVASAGLTARLQAAERKTDAAAAQVVALQKELAQKGAGTADSKPGPTNESAASNHWSKPGFASMEVGKFRAALSLRYGAFYRARNLSEEQIAKFETALTEGYQGVVDIWSAASSLGIGSVGDTPTSTSLARMTSDPLKAANENVKALLGEDGFKEYEQFDRTKTAREFTATVAGSVYGTEAPLTAQQGEALTRILDSNTKTVKIRMADDGSQPIYSLSEVTDWDAVNSQARAVLSPSQLKVLRALGEQTRLERDMDQVLNPPVTANTKPPGE